MSEADELFDEDEEELIMELKNKITCLKIDLENLNDKYIREKIAKEEVEELLENYIPKEAIREKLEILASLEHERWSKWQRYVHSMCIKNEDGSLTIPKERVEHWEWEIKTKYNDLPENLKEYDREEIRVFLKEILGE